MRGTTVRNIAGMVFAAAAPCHAMAQAEGSSAMPGQANVADPDIVVTAQRRVERLVDVPMSVTAISGKELEAAGASTTQDLTLVTPGLLIARSSTFTQPTIRGIGNRNSGPGDEPNVSIFIDGVLQSEQASTFFELADIERIEVLKGPQGTLFGRNATGGAINIITHSPKPELEGSASISAGRFGYLKGTAVLSGALNKSGTLLGSISGVGVRDHGFIDNVFLDKRVGGRKAYASRAKLFFVPRDGLEFQLNGLYSSNEDNSAFSGQPLNGNTVGRRTPDPAIPIDIAVPTVPYRTATNFVPTLKARTWFVDGHAKVDLGFATLQGLASYSKSHIRTISDLDVSAWANQSNDQNLKAHSSNEELNITSAPGSRLQWIGGVSFFQGRSFYDPQVLNGSTRIYGQKTRAFSAFGEATYEIFDRLFVTGGIRYSEDKRISTYIAPPAAAIHGRVKYTDVSPRAVVRWEFGEDANLYASYSEGYKSGTFNAGTAVGAVVPAKPERVEAYEVGGKARLLPGLTVTAAAFHYQYTNLQTTVITTVNGVLSGVLQNAPEADVKGLEATAVWRPTPRLQFNAGLSLLRPRITDFPNASVNVPTIVDDVAVGGNSAVSRDVSGNDLIRAPRRSLNLGASYGIDIAGGELVFAGNALFSAKYYLELGNRVVQPAYEVVNGSITYTLPGDHFSVSVFGQNLTKQLYFQSNTISTIADTVSYSKPRWFGVTLSAKL